MSNNEYFITVTEVMEIMHVKEGQAYKMMRQCNEELKAKGFMTVRGRVPRDFFFERVGLSGVAS